ncbi:endocuticle structural glycoprotein SgAbd-8-like [Penaeus indicus]|uniref:endocuticle structural glycoprotein SgAbd-8-like n=2 Tax=Penaeus indicus TaxID=29960 RepID=UPI00300C92BF
MGKLGNIPVIHPQKAIYSKRHGQGHLKLVRRFDGIKGQAAGSAALVPVQSLSMKFLILACVAAVAVAAPQYSYGAPRAASSEEVEFVPILKDDRVHEEDGTYNFDFEAANGISFSQAGSPDGDDDAVIKAGEYSYTAPDGTEIHVRFVADENGFQPQGAHLPVAPEFPHPIPQFVLDQIAKAAEEDRNRSDESDEVSAPSRLYGRPN